MNITTQPKPTADPNYLPRQVCYLVGCVVALYYVSGLLI